MCSSEAKVTMALEASSFSKLNARPVLQPTCNRTLDRRNSLKKISLQKPPPPPPLSTPTATNTKSSTATTPPPPPSPKSKSPRPPAIKRAGTTTDTPPLITTTNTNTHTNALLLNSSSDKIVIPRNTAIAIPKTTTTSLERIKKSKSFKEGEASLSYSSSLILDSPGSIAAVRREQMALQHAQRKMRIAHYGRSKSAKFESKVVPLLENATPRPTDHIDDHEEHRRCSFITPTTDPVYVAYHDEEWGVPVHDDNMLFELLVLSGAQVGSDWSSILKKRQDFRDAFSGFDAETVASFSDKQMMSISAEYNIDISRVRGVVDNSNRILEVKKALGSFNNYIWGFINHKAISTQYKFGHKIPVKTSKSESISKDMVRRGFRFVGPTVVHSFMQAAGLTNDHLITCHRHLPCTLLGARPARGV